MKKTVLLTKPIDQAGMKLLNKTPWIETIRLEDFNESELDEVWPQVHAIVARSFPVDAGMIHRASQLEIIAQHGVGLDAIDVDAAEHAGVYVTNAPQTNTVSVAEFTMTLILMLSKNLIRGLELNKSGNACQKDTCTGSDIEGKTLAVVGFGNIGKKLASLAYGMGMKIAAYDPYVSPDDFEKYHALQVGSLDDIFPMADYLSLHMPGIEPLRGMINEKRLSSMKKSAYLINCARGMLINETDLIHALENGTIAGAALDVTCCEPLPADSRLLQTPNLYITPHIAAITQESLARMSETAIKNVIAVLSGEKPANPVNTPVNKSDCKGNRAAKEILQQTN